MFSGRVVLGFLLMSGGATAQQYIISTIAGGAPPPTAVSGLSVSIGGPWGLTTDNGGNVYFAAQVLHCVFKLDQRGILTLVAGNSRAGYSGDGGPAISAQLNSPYSAAVDGAGNVFIADGGNNLIRKVSPSGIITTVAGSGVRGFSGDGAPATSAALDRPYGVVVDAAGNLFISDSGNNRIRKVSPSGIITTVAGNGVQGFSGDGGPATSAALSALYGGVAVDAMGDLFISDIGNNRIREVTPAGIIDTVAGTGVQGFSGDGGLATSAELYAPDGLALDSGGNLFIADALNNCVRKVTPAGIITTVAGTGTRGFSGDGGPATSAALWDARSVAVDLTGNLLVVDQGNNRIRKVSPNGIISTFAGNGSCCFSGDGGPATSAEFSAFGGVAFDPSGALFFTDALKQSRT